MVIVGIPREEIRHTWAVQDWLAEGRQEGRIGVTTAQIQALPVEKLEALADALLDFQGPVDLAANTTNPS